MLARLKAVITRLLETVVVSLVLALTAVVVIAVVYRKAGASLSWYDEVASILLAWVTYYGAALAALKRQHIGFDGIVRAVSPAWRLAFVVVSEIAVFGFFALLAWTGCVVLSVLEGDTLVSLPSVSVQLTQSVIPIGAVLFIVCEALSLPAYWRELREGTGAEMPSDPSARGEPEP
jgi:TRAP-type C4-dicarboxylate transport system permease small subunit